MPEMNPRTKHFHGHSVVEVRSFRDCKEDTVPLRNADLSAVLLIPGLGNNLEENNPLPP